jgi:hypothetical protein
MEIPRASLRAGQLGDDGPADDLEPPLIRDSFDRLVRGTLIRGRRPVAEGRSPPAIAPRRLPNDWEDRRPAPQRPRLDVPEVARLPHQPSA